jgi:hypothetical protein
MELPTTMDIPQCASQVSQEQATKAMQAVITRLHGTQISSAVPSRLQGLVELGLQNGGRMYTDCRGQYVIMGVMFDLNSPDEQLGGHP